MSLGSRITKRGRAAIITSLVSTPREPLLFLYPQWARNSSTASQAAASSRTKDSDDKVSYEPVAQNDASTPAIIDGQSVGTLPPRFFASPTKKRIDVKNNAAKSPGSEALLTELRFPEKKPAYSPPAGSTLVDIEKMVRKIMHAEEKREVAEHTAHEIRDEYQQYRRIRTENWVPDWREVLADLIEHTPRHGQWFENQIQVIVPPDARELLMTGLDCSIWEIAQTYGCSVGLGSYEPAKSGHGSFVLSGSRFSISRTLADVLRLAPDARITTTEDLQLSRLDPSSFDIANVQMKVRSVISTRRLKPLVKRPDEIRKPKAWTQASLLDYIHDLTNLEVPYNPSDDKREQYYEEIQATIRNLFKDPDDSRRSAISRKACHEALSYYVRKNRFEDVRVLFVRMEILGLPLTPKTFNIMLLGAAKQEDIHNFHFILHLMLRRGFMPNGGTWTAFMRTLNDFRTKVHVATAMKHAGLLSHKSTMKEVCQELVKPEVELSLEAFQDQEAFVSHMDSRYGLAWLTVDTGNVILHELGSRGLISRCWDFLQFMDFRCIRPDSFSINTILNHCKQTGNLSGAIQLMQNISPSWGIQLNEETFRILFALAWATRSYNIAKVVWKYACIAGNTNFRMRHAVLHSMRRSWHLPNTPRSRFECYAGSVICGLHSPMPLIVPSLKALQPNLPPAYKPISYVYDEKIGNKELKRRYDVVHQRLSYDLQMAKLKITPKYSFQEALDSAWLLDQSWRKNGSYRNLKLQGLTEAAVKVVFELREEAGDTRQLIM